MKHSNTRYTIAAIAALILLSFIPAPASSTHGDPGHFNYTGVVAWLWSVDGVPVADAGVLTVTVRNGVGEFLFVGAAGEASCQWTGFPSGTAFSGQLRVGLITDSCDTVWAGLHSWQTSATCHALIMPDGKSRIRGMSISTPPPLAVGPCAAV